jgi:hypothetical protein
MRYLGHTIFSDLNQAHVMWQLALADHAYRHDQVQFI